MALANNRRSLCCLQPARLLPLSRIGWQRLFLSQRWCGYPSKTRSFRGRKRRCCGAFYWHKGHGNPLAGGIPQTGIDKHEVLVKVLQAQTQRRTFLMAFLCRHQTLDGGGKLRRSVLDELARFGRERQHGGGVRRKETEDRSPRGFRRSGAFPFGSPSLAAKKAPSKSRTGFCRFVSWNRTSVP